MSHWFSNNLYGNALLSLLWHHYHQNNIIHIYISVYQFYIMYVYNVYIDIQVLYIICMWYTHKYKLFWYFEENVDLQQIWWAGWEVALRSIHSIQAAHFDSSALIRIVSFGKTCDKAMFTFSFRCSSVGCADKFFSCPYYTEDSTIFLNPSVYLCPSCISEFESINEH